MRFLNFKLCPQKRFCGIIMPFANANSGCVSCQYYIPKFRICQPLKSVDYSRKSRYTNAMSLDARIWLLCKYLVWLVFFVGLAMPVELIWLLIFPFVYIVKKKQEAKTGVYIDINAWSAMELYMRFSKKFLGISD